MLFPKIKHAWYRTLQFINEGCPDDEVRSAFEHYLRISRHIAEKEGYRPPSVSFDLVSKKASDDAMAEAPSWRKDSAIKQSLGHILEYMKANPGSTFKPEVKRVMNWLARRGRKRTYQDDCCWLHICLLYTSPSPRD